MLVVLSFTDNIFAICIILLFYASAILFGTHKCDIVNYMLFNKKHQKRIQITFAVISILVIISMILLYSPIFLPN